jgi:hypothetical protein
MSIMLSMKVNGVTIFSMGMALKHGKMVRQNIQGNFSKEKRMAKEDLNGKTEVFMREIL